MKKIKTEIDNAVARILPDAVADLSALIKIESSRSEPAFHAPFGIGPKRALDFMIAKSASAGFIIGNVDGYAGYAELRAHNPEAETVGVLTHLDTVPLGFGWTKEQGMLTKGRIWGRGAVDNKGPTIACFHALNLISKAGKQPALKRNIRLIWGLNEESGNECMDYYSKKIGMPDIGFSPDADFPIITCEKTILQLQMTFPLQVDGLIDWSAGTVANAVPAQSVLRLKKELAHKAVCCLRDHPTWGTFNLLKSGDIEIISKGQSAHSMRPQEGDNASWKSAWILAEILDNACPAHFKKFVSLYTNDSATQRLGIERADKESGAQTINIGLISFMAGRLSVTLDFRCPITQDIKALTDKIKASVPNAIVKLLYLAPYLYAEKDSELVRALGRAYSETTGQPVKHIISGGGTYARKMKNCVAFGPMLEGINNHIHDADEYLDLDHFEALIKIYYKAMLNLAL